MPIANLCWWFIRYLLILVSFLRVLPVQRQKDFGEKKFRAMLCGDCSNKCVKSRAQVGEALILLRFRDARTLPGPQGRDSIFYRAVGTGHKHLNTLAMCYILNILSYDRYISISYVSRALVKEPILEYIGKDAPLKRLPFPVSIPFFINIERTVNHLPPSVKYR